MSMSLWQKSSGGIYLKEGDGAILCEECPECEEEECEESEFCAACQNGLAPPYVQIDLAGLVTTNFPWALADCGACNPGNGTYVIPWSSNCSWDVDLGVTSCNPPFACTVRYISVQLGSSGGSTTIHVSVVGGSGTSPSGAWVRYQSVIPAIISCAPFEFYSVPFLSQGNSSPLGGNPIDGSSSSCTLTMLDHCDAS